MRMCAQVGLSGLSAYRRHLLTIESGPKLLETIPVCSPEVTDQPQKWCFNMLTVVSGEPVGGECVPSRVWRPRPNLHTRGRRTFAGQHQILPLPKALGRLEIRLGMWSGATGRSPGRGSQKDWHQGGAASKEEESSAGQGGGHVPASGQ